MHSGFTALRSHCPMNIEALLPDTGALIWRDQPGVRADVQRLVEMWGALLQEHGGPMLFGQFTVADACLPRACASAHLRFARMPPHIAAYVQRVRELPGVKAWIDEALAEKDFLDFEDLPAGALGSGVMRATVRPYRKLRKNALLPRNVRQLRQTTVPPGLRLRH